MADKANLKILYVEDEPDLRERIRIVLGMEFQTVLTAENGRDGLDIFHREAPDVVVCDIRMPVMDGLEMTARVRKSAPGTPVILCTAFTETAYLLKAIELGVSAYVAKPLDCRNLVQTITRVALPILQQKELALARENERASMELLLGRSPAMQEAIRQAQRIAQSEFSVIIQGETGVGKSHLASIIHGLSRRRGGPFITVTVSALPESLVESQLFGHLKGAFTGAVATTRGLFEEADGGPSSSTMSTALPPPYRRSSCTRWKGSSSTRSEGYSRCMSTPASSRRATGSFSMRCRAAPSARTSTTA